MLKPLHFNCKGDNFKLKQIHLSLVVSVGTNLRILGKLISEACLGGVPNNPYPIINDPKYPIFLN